MGSRTWIKIYCDKWLNGSIREEELEVRAVWVDLLVLTGSGKYGDSGEVKITDEMGFLNQQLADLLQISTRKWKIISKRLQETDRICISEHNVITIKNWSKYQSEYERTNPYRIGDTVTKSTTQSTAEGTDKSTARDRDKRLEIENRDTENAPPNPPVSQVSTKQVIEHYEENILLGGRVNEEMDYELSAACARYSQAWVLDAIKESLAQNHATWQYIVGILKNWQRYGKK